MRVLWLTNVRFANSAIKSTGTWLQPLAEALMTSIEIVHITRGNVLSLEEEWCNGIRQFVLPVRKTRKAQIPDEETALEVKAIISQIKPDLIHVWGTESVWAYMNVMGVFGECPVLLDIQGLMFTCYEAYYGGLTFKERLMCLHMKEFLKPSSSVFSRRKWFFKASKIEEDILRSYKNISYQSDWVKNMLYSFNLDAHLFSTRILLRQEFYNVNWEKPNDESRILFTMCSSPVPYKGLHILIKALAIIKRRYPHVILQVAGNFAAGRAGLRNGYAIFLSNLIQNLGVRSNVCFTGPLSATEIVEHLKNCDVCVIPSFVESYCLSLAESMALGTPCVVSYAAAMPTIARDKSEALFYNSLDYIDCAEKVIHCMENDDIVRMLSKNARKRCMEDSSVLNVVNNQLSIYKKILSE